MPDLFVSDECPLFAFVQSFDSSICPRCDSNQDGPDTVRRCDLVVLAKCTYYYYSAPFLQHILLIKHSTCLSGMSLGLITFMWSSMYLNVWEAVISRRNASNAHLF